MKNSNRIMWTVPIMIAFSIMNAMKFVALDLIPDFIAPGRVTVNQLPHQFHLLVEACTQPLHVIERMPVLILLRSKRLVRYES